ncbi:MAG: hypothetical protein CSA72_06600 [Rhodobacterales bacterium]|nr:MAG: hypothetical protein CSA72_06600 [Rhodobacterales bacterium]
MRLTPRGLWAFGRLIPVTIGRGGITRTKTEGDGGTPVGTHRIVGTLYRPDRMAPPAPWAIPIGLRDRWSDDAARTDYNQMVRAPYPGSSEALRRSDPLYDLILLTDWNWPEAMPGAGSAIFLHRWRRPGAPTEGCIAMAPAQLRWLAARAAPGTVLIVP